MLYKNFEIFNHGINDGLYGYTYLKPSWNDENLKDYENGLKIGLIQNSIKENNFLNATYENFYNQYNIHIWSKNKYKALSIIIENKKDLKEFRKLTGITSIKKQN